MNKKNLIILIVSVLIVVIAGLGGYWFYESKTEIIVVKKVEINPKNCAYVIDGKNITLKNGYFEELAVDGSASKTVTQYFGNEVKADFNNDGVEDTVFLLTQNSAGSGTFYYVAGALSSEDGCVGTNAVLLGDRIAPQTTEFKDGKIIVNYADRNPGEPMTTVPSLGVSKYFEVDNGKLLTITNP